MVEEQAVGRVVDIDEGGEVTIKALANLDRIIRRDVQDVTIIFHDGRKISPEQRRKVYALIGEIAEYTDGIRDSQTIEDTKRVMKFEFIMTRMEAVERKMFSLSGCDMTVAREFINFLIDFIVENDIPTRISLAETAEDIPKYVYACMMNKKCAVCGRAAQLHHVEPVGAGRNRDEICHIGMLALPLCADHHTETHTIGVESFKDKYHLEPVKIDKTIAKVFRLKGKTQE